MDAAKPYSLDWDRLADASLIGADVPRREDGRFLSGQGRYLADLRLPGMRELAFVRSTIAHGRIKSVSAPRHAAPGSVWTARELDGVAKPMVAALLRESFRRAPYTALATDAVRFVGEAVAAVLADTRTAADDLAEAVHVDAEPLPSVTDAVQALSANAPRLRPEWPDNSYMTIERATPGFESAAAKADVHVTRSYRMARAGPMPIETRGCVAWFDRRNDQLILWTSTQRPHLIRGFVAQHLVGFDERRVQVIVPDVGGAFGVKTNFYPEELVVAAIATQVDHPVRWIETRFEHMLTACHAREQIQTITAHAMRDGTLVALEADIIGDGGAYSMITSTGAIEANMAVSVLPGPYRFTEYKLRARSASTNKTPMGPYRGVGRPGAVFAMERTIDEVAHELGMPPNAVRLKNVVAPGEFPWKTPSGLTYDSGDYPGLIRLAEQAMKQTPSKAKDHERVGVGYAMYVEQTAHGTAEFVARGSSVLYGFESARVTLDLSGALTVEVGVLSQGQGLETTLAQVAGAVTGLPLERISVRQGDTNTCPFGMGTVASRSMVMAGGAVYHACLKLTQKLRAIAAKQLECKPEEIVLRAGVASGPAGRLEYTQLADIAWQNIQKLPTGMEPGLEFLHLYRPEIESGTFASGMHAVRIAVDLETGVIRVLDYVVVEDCGQEINPMIVEGQVRGGVAQGIGQALSEAFRYDADGQPLCGSFMDYAMPGFAEVPNIRIEHQHTLSTFGVFGMKGTGEGGCIAPPAAIANAVCDALHDLNIGVAEVPLTANAVWQALRRAGQDRIFIGEAPSMGK